MTLRRVFAKLISDRSILTKLIVSLFIIVMPLYAFNYYINQIGADKNRHEIEYALMNSLQSYNNILDNEFLRIQQLLDKSALDIAVSHVELLEDTITPVEKSIYFEYIRNHLSRIQYSTRFIRDTEAHMPIMDITLSPLGNKEFDSGTFEALTRQGDPFIFWNGELYMNTPFVTARNDGNGLFILAVTVSREVISSYLSKIMSFERGSALLFNGDNTWEISTDRHNATDAEVKQHVMTDAANDPGPPAPRMLNREISGEPYTIVYERSTYSDGMLVAYAPQSEIYGSLSIYQKFFYTMSVLSILLIVLISLGIYKLIHKPMRSLVHAFRRVEIGQLQFTLEPQSEDEFGYLYRRFNTMTETLNTMVNVVYEQKLLGQRSELKRLQSQINPHFLYNNFFVLQRLIRSKQIDKAATFTEYLGKYFQFVTRDAADEITLEEDVKHAGHYLEIQQVCFDRRVAVSLQPLPDEMKRLLVPRLIVQPLIENSFHHVFEHQLAEGFLSVSFHTDEQAYRITVEDNGQQLDDKQLDALSQKLTTADKHAVESTGIVNVHRRLRLKFGEQSGLQLSRSQYGGLKAQIIIEKKEGEA
ncbi:sensor histidine kinase [Paenibacillus sp. 1P07SE]|uniref:sensor histidine kinase n=1 Tax=Paenibacillus sp. 1P07SE TaxID=3132209 RepID=UPI0039A5E49D